MQYPDIRRELVKHCKVAKSSAVAPVEVQKDVHEVLRRRDAGAYILA